MKFRVILFVLELKEHHGAVRASFCGVSFAVKECGSSQIFSCAFMPFWCGRRVLSRFCVRKKDAPGPEDSQCRADESSY